MAETPVPVFPGRLAIQQRVLPIYRVDFFDLLAESCQDGLSVFAGQPLPQEGIAAASSLSKAQLVPARNWNFLDPHSRYYQCWQAGLVEWLEAWQPEALIVEANPRYRSTPAAIRWMHARNRPVLGWGLGAPPSSGRLGWIRNESRRKFLRSVDGLIAYSQRGAQEYQALGIPAGRIFVAPNAVARRPTAPAPERPAEIRRRARLLFVGRLQERKRIDSLLQASAALPPELQPELWVVGDGPARPALEDLARQIYPPAEFPGMKLGAELEGYFRRADLFVLPGTGGLAVQQAMAYALPVIVAEADGTQNDLVRPESGWLVPPGDVAGLSQALKRGLSDVRRLRQMGAAAYRIVSQEVNLELMVGGFLQALQTVAVKR